MLKLSIRLAVEDLVRLHGSDGFDDRVLDVANVDKQRDVVGEHDS